MGYKMKIVVTGGAGFIGSHVVDAYINDGHEVIVVDNLSTGRRENLNPRAKFYEMDICDAKIAEIFEKEKPEILNHHAAQIDVRVSVANPSKDIEINVIGFVNLIEAGRRNGLKKVILASTGGAGYGEQDFFPATEQHPMRPISPYGLNKLACEQYLHYYSYNYGINYVALRYANIYGPRQNAHGEAGVVAIFTNKMLAGEQPVINGDGKQTRDYVFVGDVVESNLLALKNNLNGAYNVGSAVETDVNTIFRILREIIDSKCEEKHVPTKQGEQLRSVIKSERFKKELGWQPKVIFAEGLKLTTEWFKKQHFVKTAQSISNLK